MNSLTVNEIRSVIRILKEPAEDYNANTLSKDQGITSMGALKILKKMRGQNILNSKKLGNAVYYKPNLDDEYPENFFEFILRKEAEESPAKIKKWVRELRKLSGKAQAAILFGSVLEKDWYNDVDILLILRPGQVDEAEKGIEELNRINVKRIHALKQTRNDIIENIRKKDKTVLGALRNGIVLFGYKEVLGVIKDASR
jgi:predicted nucleotidyltransferase